MEITAAALPARSRSSIDFSGPRRVRGLQERPPLHFRDPRRRREVMVDVDALRAGAGRPLRADSRRPTDRRDRGGQKASSIDLVHGMRNVFLT
jgi:hypothetical protein